MFVLHRLGDDPSAFPTSDFETAKSWIRHELGVGNAGELWHNGVKIAWWPTPSGEEEVTFPSIERQIS